MPPEKPLPPTSSQPLKIVYLTAGAAGMICGSCLHDNTLARELIRMGHDVQLVPLYTPLRTDEENVAGKAVFFGGINMYLQQKARIFRALPKWLDRWLDQPWLIEWAAGRSVRIDPPEVADLTLSILRGTDGFQRKEIERLIDWLVAEGKPDVIVFSNMLTAGCVPEIKRRLGVPVVVTLQGDDIFLRGLPDAHRAQALALIGQLGQEVDAYIANSRFYADAMSAYLGLPRARIEVVPLGVQVEDFRAPRSSPMLPSSASPANRPPTLGYLARIAPEKGLHILAQAFALLRSKPGMAAARLRIAGWLGGNNRPYFEQIMTQLRAVGAGGAVEHLGEVDRAGKVELLHSLDVLSVPTTYEEPKGLFALEALAAGVPVVLPNHGAFPEMLADTGGGLLHRPADPADLAARLYEVLANRPLRERLAAEGQQQINKSLTAQRMAEQTLVVLRHVIAAQESEARNCDSLA